jgi:hypothetical protein
MTQRKQYNIHISREELYHCYIELQQSTPDIAKQIGCSKRTIILRLRDYNIPVRLGKDAHNTESYTGKFKKVIPESELREKYVTELLGMREIGKLYNCSAGCVRNNLREYGMHIRTKKEAQATPSCVTGRDKVIALGRTLERREHSRRIMNKRYEDPAEKEKIGNIMRQYHKDNPEFSEQQTKLLEKARLNPEVRRRQIENSKRSWTPERRSKQAERSRALWQNPEFRAKRVAMQKKQWRANNFEFLKKMMLANCISPNKPETSVLVALDDMYPNEWKFTGDGQIIIDGLNPDFINANGKKLIIEVFGDYWHRQGVKPYRVNEGRVDVYAKYGYRTLIIWEKETKDSVLLRQKIQEFVECQKM